LKQLAHDPFCTKAREYGNASREIYKYSQCMAKWARFFGDIAREKQEAYQENRKALLLEEASKNRTTYKPRKRNLTIKSVHDERKQALENLIKAGLSKEKISVYEALIGA